MKQLINNSYKRSVRLFIYTAVTTALAIAVYTGEGWVMAHSEENVVEVSNPDPVLNGTSTQVYNYINTYYDEVEYVYDDEMYEDEVEITQYEEAGTKETTVIMTFYNGEIQERKMLDEEVIKEAVPRVVHIGTKERHPFILPVESYVLSSGFGPRWGTNHNGIDLAVPTGTSVHASADGVVIQSGWNGGYGISVYIDHGNGVITRYGHMSETLVSVGQEVSQGDLIGLSGSTGDSTGPHVHFEMREKDAAFDPIRYVEY